MIRYGQAERVHVCQSSWMMEPIITKQKSYKVHRRGADMYQRGEQIYRSVEGVYRRAESAVAGAYRPDAGERT